MWKTRIAYKVLAGKPEKKETIALSIFRYNNNLKIVLREVVCENM
jgi:hypothetical protein